MMKNKRVILHIGTGKTGTTSIQQSLFISRGILENYNVYYPKTLGANHIYTFVPLFLEDPCESNSFKIKLSEGENKYEKCRDLKKKWIEEFKECNCDNFVISAEDLSLPLFSLEALKKCIDFLENYFIEILAVVYIRHFDTYIVSHFQQIIKNGYNHNGLKGLLNRYIDTDTLSYKTNLEKYIKCLGVNNIIFRPFDVKVWHNNDLVDDFLNMVDAKSVGVIKKHRVNDSMGEHSFAFLEKYNAVYPLIINGETNSNRGLSSRYSPHLYFKDIEDKKLTINISYSNKQARRLNDDIDWVNQYFVNGYRFDYVKSSGKPLQFPRVEDIPVDFYIELFNKYNKEIERLLNEIDNLNYLLSTKKVFAERVLEAYVKNKRRTRVQINNMLRYVLFRIKKPEWFDGAYYAKRYPHVLNKTKHLFLHYMFRGVYYGYTPNEDFNTEEHLMRYPELLVSGENAYLHYLKTL